MIRGRITYFLIVKLIISGYFVTAKCPDNRELLTKIDYVLNNMSRRESIAQLNQLVLSRKECSRSLDSSDATLFHVLGRTLWYEFKLDSAILMTRQAIRINSSKSRSAKPQDLCNSYYNLAGIYIDKGDFNTALKLLENAIGIGLKYPEKRFIVSDAYSVKASIYISLGNYLRAISAADYGYQYALDEADHDMMAKNLVEKGQALLALREFKRADDALSQALKLVSKDNRTSLGAIYSLLARSSRDQNKASKVIDYYHRSFENFKAANNDYGCGQVAASLAYYYRQHLGKIDKAEESYKIALAYMKNRMARAVIYNDMSEIYRISNDFDKSLRVKQTAFEEILPGLFGKSYLTIPSFGAIKPILDKSSLLTIFQDKADTWLAYAKHTNNAKPKLQNALRTYMLADTMIDYMRWEHTGNVTKLFWREKTRTMYERAIETCYLLNDPAKAFYFFEKSRAVMLNDQLNELGANQLLSSKDQEIERLLKQKVTELQNKLLETEHDEKAAGGLRTKLFTAQEEQESFIKELEKNSPQYYAYKYDNRVPELAEFRSRLLADNQSFVSYFVGDSAFYGLAVSKNSISFKKLKLADYINYNAQFQKLIGSRDLQNRQFSDYLKVSNQLYDILLKPFGIAPDSRVIVSPDGSFLPFEALSSSPVSPEYLVKKYAFSYTYSAGYLAKSIRSAASGFSIKSFLGLSPVKFAPQLSLAALPGSDLVLKFIDDHFFFSKTLTGAEASRNAFIKNSPDYSIVQLFTHATADSSGTIPTLYFADSTLKLSELAPGQKSKTELLVLSACRTGVGKNQRGEGVFSLARGFAGMGIPSTLTTLWSVENDPIYALTKLFYTELAKKLPLDIALQNAQNEWLETASPGERLPYAWAGMVLVGNSEPVDMGISKTLAYAMIGIFIVLVVFLTFYLRGRKFARK